MLPLAASAPGAAIAQAGRGAEAAEEVVMNRSVALGGNGGGRRVPSSQLYERLREKAAGSYCIPGSRRTRVAVETLKDWLQAYRAGGFEALRPKPRKDIGQARSIPQNMVDLLVHLKDEHRD